MMNPLTGYNVSLLTMENNFVVTKIFFVFVHLKALCLKKDNFEVKISLVDFSAHNCQSNSTIPIIHKTISFQSFLA